MGTWIITEKSAEKLQETIDEDFFPTLDWKRIELIDEHKITITGLNDLEDSKSGTWDIIESELFHYVQGGQKNTYILEIRVTVDNHTDISSFYIYENNNELMLWSYLVDPDSLDYLEFIKY